ncbi:MAG: dephospho-CoA kinase [Rhodocyclaceae bacterium]|nr:dephospho-CoA kinase [Rhodocyclaceae bacterium]
MSFVVGLTGGIGSGKSAAADRFAALGARLIDTDAIAHALTAPGGAAIAPIVRAFGEEVLTPEGALDRAAMRRRVFADPAERQRLEAILHPLIRAVVAEALGRPASADLPRRGGARRDACSAASGDFPYTLLVVPLLVETGAYREHLDRILVIDCPVELQIARVMARSGLSHAEVSAILAAQATRQARLAQADDVIDNDASLEALMRQVDALHHRYCALAAQSRD